MAGPSADQAHPGAHLHGAAIPCQVFPDPIAVKPDSPDGQMRNQTDTEHDRGGRKPHLHRRSAENKGHAPTAERLFAQIEDEMDDSATAQLFPALAFYRSEAARCRKLAANSADRAAGLRWLDLALEYDRLAHTQSRRDDSGRRAPDAP